MIYYTPNNETVRPIGSDAFAFAYMARNCPAAIDYSRCFDTGALVIDFVDGSTLEISNGEREAHNGVYLHGVGNAKAWLASLKAERNRRIIDAIASKRIEAA